MRITFSLHRKIFWNSLPNNKEYLILDTSYILLSEYQKFLNSHCNETSTCLLSFTILIPRANNNA